jgi:hypothetical protein
LLITDSDNEYNNRRCFDCGNLKPAAKGRRTTAADNETEGRRMPAADNEAETEQEEMMFMELDDEDEHPDAMKWEEQVERLKTDNEMAADLCLAMTRNHVSGVAIRTILVDLGATLSSAATDIRKDAADSKKLMAWLKSHRVVRPHFNKPPAILMRLASAIEADVEGVTTAAGIRKKIVSFLERFPDTVPPADDLVEVPQPADGLPLLTKSQTLLRIALESSYLPKLEGQAKGYANRGHELEKPILERLLRHSREGLTPIKVLELGSAPLVLRNNVGMPCVGGSVDAVARAVVPVEGEDDEDQEEELILVEAKARVTASTEAKERRRQGYARLANGANSRRRHATRTKYWEINAQSEDFAFFVDDKMEALQILHHAFVYDVRYVLLLMGNDTADIISGIFVKFDISLKEAWKCVLRDMGRLSLKWAYYDGTRNGPNFDREFIDPVLARIKLHNKKDGALDFASFHQWVLLWYDIRFRKALPLPPIARIIPFAISMWNAFKGGSDTLTKLIWNADYDPPTDDIQAHAVARLLLLSVTVIHRLRHMATAKADLNFYRSLRHYRNAANKRASFHKTLLDLSMRFGGDPRVSGAVFAGLPPTVSTRARTRFAPLVENIMGGVTIGKTPVRNAAVRMQTLMETSEDNLDERDISLIDRWSSCTGPLVYCVNEEGKRGPKGKCFVCSTQTSWICLGCHNHFCGTTEVPDENERQGRPKRRKINMPCSSGAAAKSVIVRNSCWLHKHVSALECETENV